MSDLKANPGATLLAEIAARECTNNRATGQTCDESDAWVRDYKRRNGMKEEGSIVTRCDPCRARACAKALSFR